jgi:hypothetical protein
MNPDEVECEFGIRMSLFINLDKARERCTDYLYKCYNCKHNKYKPPQYIPSKSLYEQQNE